MNRWWKKLRIPLNHHGIGIFSKISEKIMFSDSVTNIVNFVKRLLKKSQITINCRRKNIANLVKMFQKWVMNFVIWSQKDIANFTDQLYKFFQSVMKLLLQILPIGRDKLPSILTYESIKKKKKIHQFFEENCA